MSRLQAATAVTALFVGGTIAAGIALRPDASTSAGTAAAPEVIQKRKVKTISVPAGPPVSTPVVASAAPGGYEREDEGEVEHGESD